MFIKKIVFATCIIFCSVIFAQLEYVSPQNSIYSFLLEMKTKGIIQNYSHSMIPIDRRNISNYLKTINKSKHKLSSVEKLRLKKFASEYNLDLKSNLSLLDNFTFKNFFKNSQYKYLYKYKDDNATFFLSGLGKINYRSFQLYDTKSLNITTGEFGFRFHSTLYNKLAFYFKILSGRQLHTNDDISRKILTQFSPMFKANEEKFINSGGEKFYELYEGYLRYELISDVADISLGREAIKLGRGYIDNLFLSTNTVPYDFLKINLKYKRFRYSFLYSNIRGSYDGKILESKNLVNHRLEINLSKKFSVGFSESLIFSERPLSMTFLNPVSFLTSADHSATGYVKNISNTILGLDLEYNTFDNLSFQFSFLVDDLNFRTLGTGAHDNKFAYQFGIYYYKPFNLQNLNLMLEYTRLDPYMYTHRTNKNQYTHFGMPLGHKLNPNSDEIAIKLDYWPHHRINVRSLVQLQRSANGLKYDKEGKVIVNYGGDYSEGQEIQGIKFLDGNRINRSIYTLDITYEFIRQYYLKFHYQRRMINNIFESKKYHENIFYFVIEVNI